MPPRIPWWGRCAGPAHRCLHVHGSYRALSPSTEPTEWLCTECLSLNGRRSDRCYRCRTPRFAAEAIEGVREPKPATTLAESSAASGDLGGFHAVKGAPPYRSARPYANAAIALIVAATIATVVHFALAVLAARATLSSPDTAAPLFQPGVVEDPFGNTVDLRPSPRPDAVEADTSNAIENEFNATPLGVLTNAISLDPRSNALPIALSRLVQVGLVGVAIVVFGLWLARAVENVPAIGGGWPSLTPAWAFFLCLIPGVNLIRPAGMVRELFERIPGPNGASAGLVSIWWVALFAGAVLQVPRLGGAVLRRAVSIVLLVTSGSQRDALRIDLILNGIGVILSIAAAVLVVRLVSTMQARLEERAANIVELAPQAAPAG